MKEIAGRCHQDSEVGMCIGELRREGVPFIYLRKSQLKKYIILICTVWWVLFQQGHSTRWFVQMVSTQREVIMEREGGRCDGEGRGMCHERKSRRCPQEEGRRCRGEGRMKLELS